MMLTAAAFFIGFGLALCLNEITPAAKWVAPTAIGFGVVLFAVALLGV